MKSKYLTISGIVSIVVSAAIGCRTDDVVEDGSCTLDTASIVDCSVKRLVGEPFPAESIGIKSYLCSGSARPDGEPTYVDGAPQGLVCDDKGDVSGQGRGYCCNDVISTCAYDPSAECPDETYSGYNCLGIRPDFLNPLLYCREGVHSGGYINFCCRDKEAPKPDGVTPSFCQPKVVAGVVCASGLAAWQCPETDTPKSEEIPQNGSRSDFYAPMCSAMGPVENKVVNYCCFTPKLPPVGASCEARTGVPGCGYGRFGFACFGVDKPSDYHTPMICNEPSMEGTSEVGYPATLYCCDYDLQLALSATTAAQ